MQAAFLALTLAGMLLLCPEVRGPTTASAADAGRLPRHRVSALKKG